MLICLAAVVLFILVFFAIVSVLIQKTRFGVRSDGNPALRYFQAKDFENLQAEDISFVSDKGQTLRGCIYSDMRVKEPKGLVIWVHGFGAGHNAYTTEIAYLAAQGYLVLGYDNTGCVLSDGKGVGGLIQGAIDASYAVRCVQNEPRLKQYKRVLVGHSWGADSAMNIFSFGEHVDGVVAMCGFDTAQGVVTDMSRRYFGGFSGLIRFYSKILHRLRFGRLASVSSRKSLLKSDVPVLLLYGEDDKVVPFRTNGRKIIRAVRDKKNIRAITYPDKGHSVYLTIKAEKYIKEVFAKLASSKKMPSEEFERYRSSIDYALLTEEDAAVMGEIRDFLENIFC